MTLDQSYEGWLLLAQFSILAYVAFSTIQTLYEALKGQNFAGSQIPREETESKELIASLLYTANEECVSILRISNDETDLFKILGRNKKFEEQIGGLKELLSIHLNQQQPSNEQPDNTVETFFNHQRNTEASDQVIQCTYMPLNKSILLSKSSNESTHGEITLKRLEKDIWKLVIKDGSKLDQHQPEPVLQLTELHPAQDLNLVQSRRSNSLEEKNKENLIQFASPMVIHQNSLKRILNRDGNYFSFIDQKELTSPSEIQVSNNQQSQNQTETKPPLLVMPTEEVGVISPTSWPVSVKDSSNCESIVSNLNQSDYEPKAPQSHSSLRIQLQESNRHFDNIFINRTQSHKELIKSQKNFAKADSLEELRNKLHLSEEDQAFQDLSAGGVQIDESGLDKKIIENFSIRISRILEKQGVTSTDLQRANQINTQMQQYLANKGQIIGKENQELRNKLETNKIFLYMVIHDLKHPAESLKDQLGTVQTQINQGLEQIGLFTQNASEIDAQWELYKSLQNSYVPVPVQAEQEQQQEQPAQEEVKEQVNLLVSDNSQDMQDDNDLIDLNECTADESISIDTRPRHTRQSSLSLIGFRELANSAPVYQQIVYLIQSNQDVEVHEEGHQIIEEILEEDSDDSLQPQRQNSNQLSFNIQTFGAHSLAEERALSVSVPEVKESTVSADLTQNLSLVLALSQDGRLTLTPQEIDCLLTEQVHLLKAAKCEEKRFKQLQVQVIQMNSVASMMMNLLHDLLDLAQIEKNTFSLNNSYFSLLETVEKAFNIVKPSADLKKVQLVFQKPVSRIQSNYYREILSDQRRMIQILVNFVSNAIKFSSQGGQVTVSIVFNEVQVSQKGTSNLSRKKEEVQSPKKLNYFQKIMQESHSDCEENKSGESVTELCFVSFDIVIEDSGMGIPKDKVNTLFVNFSKINKHQKQNPHGVGLGLSICKDLIEQMGGQVKIESEEGKGTKFFISMKCVTKVHTNNSNNSSAMSFESLYPKKNSSKLLPIPEYTNTSPNRAYMKLLHSNLSFHKYQSMISQGKSKSSSEINSSNQSPQAQKLAVEDNMKLVTRCLVANDDPCQLDYISAILSQYFTEVDQAENGFVAFKLVQDVRRSNYDLIILDINMPIMGGVEASQKMSEYFNKSSLTDIVKFGQHVPLKEHVLKTFNIDNLPVIVALTADMNPDLSKGEFKAIIYSLDQETIAYLLKLAQIDKKEQAWKKCLDDLQSDSYSSEPKFKSLKESKDLYSNLIELNQIESQEGNINIQNLTELDKTISRSLMHEELKVSDSIESRSSGELSMAWSNNLQKVFPKMKIGQEKLKKLEFKRKSQFFENDVSNKSNEPSPKSASPQMISSSASPQIISSSSSCSNIQSNVRNRVVSSLKIDVEIANQQAPPALQNNIKSQELSQIVIEMVYEELVQSRKSSFIPPAQKKLSLILEESTPADIIMSVNSSNSLSEE